MAARKRIILAAILATVFVASLVALVYTYGGEESGGGGRAKDFLIVASVAGFNDSADHGVPQTPWPVIQVAKGTLVNITIYNDDHQTHSFQIARYFDSGIQTIAPGQTIHVSFIANETGTFVMRCVIPCSVHWAMQSGELIVA